MAIQAGGLKKANNNNINARKKYSTKQYKYSTVTPVDKTF